MTKEDYNKSPPKGSNINADGDFNFDSIRFSPDEERLSMLQDPAAVMGIGDDSKQENPSSHTLIELSDDGNIYFDWSDTPVLNRDDSSLSSDEPSAGTETCTADDFKALFEHLTKGDETLIETGTNIPSKVDSKPKSGMTDIPDVPDFLIQLHRMLSNDSNSFFIIWKEGKVEVKDPVGLEENVLHHHFSHSKFSSFTRQMNYFGFRKISGGAKMAPCSFCHTDLSFDLASLFRIKRKKAKGKRALREHKKALAKAEAQSKMYQDPLRNQVNGYIQWGDISTECVGQQEGSSISCNLSYTKDNFNVNQQRVPQLVGGFSIPLHNMQNPGSGVVLRNSSTTAHNMNFYSTTAPLTACPHAGIMPSEVAGKFSVPSSIGQSWVAPSTMIHQHPYRGNFAYQATPVDNEEMMVNAFRVWYQRNEIS